MGASPTAEGSASDEAESSGKERSDAERDNQHWSDELEPDALAVVIAQQGAVGVGEHVHEGAPSAAGTGHLNEEARGRDRGITVIADTDGVGDA